MTNQTYSRGAPNRIDMGSHQIGPFFDALDWSVGLGFVGNGGDIQEIEIGFQYQGGPNQDYDVGWHPNTVWRVGVFLDHEEFSAARVHHPGTHFLQTRGADYYVDFAAPSNSDFLTPIATSDDGAAVFNTYRARFDVSHLGWNTRSGEQSAAFATPYVNSVSGAPFIFIAGTSFEASPAKFRDVFDNGANPNQSFIPDSSSVHVKVGEFSGGKQNWDEIFHSQFAAGRVTASVPEPSALGCVVITMPSLLYRRRKRDRHKFTSSK